MKSLTKPAPAIPLELRTKTDAFRKLQEALAFEAETSPEFSLFGGSIGIRAGAPLTRKTVGPLAAAIRTYVLAECNHLELHQRFGVGPLCRDRDLLRQFECEPIIKEHLVSIDVLRHLGANISGTVRWRRKENTIVLPALSTENLQAAIAKKTCTTYDRPKSQIWLLMAATGETFAEHFEHFDMMLENLYDQNVVAAASTSGFARVIVWDYIGQQYADLLDDKRAIYTSAL